MDWKRIAKALLYPPVWLMIALVPISVPFLVICMVMVGTESIPAIISYVLAAYTLTVWCVRMPEIIRFFKTLRNENKYVVRWFSDERLRINVTLHSSLIWNCIYGLFQLWLGIYHGTFWFCSLAAYYIMLACLRFFFVRHTRAHKAGERMRDELIKYCFAGWVFLVMNLALSLIIFFMVYWNRTFVHHEITTIAIAAYTFTALTVAIINVIKYRKYKSPVYSATKATSLASATVSMLTLESTMLTTWGQVEGELFRRVMLASTGAAVSLFLVAMAIYMIINGTRGLKALKAGDVPSDLLISPDTEVTDGK